VAQPEPGHCLEPGSCLGSFLLGSFYYHCASALLALWGFGLGTCTLSGVNEHRKHPFFREKAERKSKPENRKLVVFILRLIH
jgi:hypothetical protein